MKMELSLLKLDIKRFEKRKTIFLKILLFMRDRERNGRDTEGEAGFLQGTRCGTRSQTPGSHPEPKADAQLLSHLRIPSTCFICIQHLMCSGHGRTARPIVQLRETDDSPNFKVLIYLIVKKKMN